MKKYFLLIVLLYPLLAFAQPVATFNPANGASAVSISNDLTVTFDVAIRAIDNTGFNNTSIDAVVTLVDGSATAVPFNATIGSGDKVITIDPTSNLAEETSYTLTIASVENSSDQATGTLQITFTTGDFTDPVVTYARIIDNLGTSFSFDIQANDQGTAFWVVSTDGTTPTEGEVEAGEDDNGPVAAGRFGSFSLTANTPNSVNVTGLTAATKYYVHYFIRDEGGNDPNPATREEPVRTASAINSGSTAATSIELEVTYNLAGNGAQLGSLPEPGVYYVATLSSTKPTHAQILAGQNHLGAGVPSGRFDVSAGASTPHTISGLTSGTTYHIHFFEVENNNSQSEIRTEGPESTLDNTPPSLVSLVPAEGFAEVDISTNTFTLTFNENVDNRSTAATDDTDRIRLFENGVLVETIDRDDGTVGANGAITGTGNTTITIEFVYALKPLTPYQILIGEDVIEDTPGSNDFDTSPSNTDPFAWNFTTSGISINNLTSNLCSGSFQSISDIVITEAGVSDINNSGILEIELANTTDFAFQTSGVSASETGSDITINSVVASFSKITLNYTRAGGTTKDVITITGIKVYATGGSPSTTIRRSGGTANMDGANALAGASLTYASINSGATPPAQPTLAASQDLIYCVGENLTTASISLVAQPGATFNWYNNVALSGSPVESTISTSVNLANDLLLTSPAVAGTYTFYVAAVTSCQSTSALPVTIQVYSNPVVNAGTDPAAICFGSSIQIGGSPTLVSTSIPGAHTYSWATPGGSISDATNPNPTVTPPSPAGANQQFSYTVTVTAPAPYNCSASDAILVDTKSTAQSVAFAQPSQFNYTVSDNPINLAGTPAGGTFSGVGVIQVGATAYEFDPQQAGLGTHSVTYVATLTNGCTKSTSQNFFVTNTVDVFTSLNAQNCSNEGFISLEFSDQLAQQAKAYVANWNANYVFLYGYSPIKFEGLVRNYYNDNDNYGWGDNGNVTASGTHDADGTTYTRYVLNTAASGYPGCPTCNFSYLQAYIEFVDPNNTAPYYIPPNTNYGYQFNKGGKAGFTFGNAESTTINIVPTVFFSGLVGLPGSPINNQRFCNASTDYTLTGNFEGGTFEISRNNVDFFTGGTLAQYGILNDGTNPGEATFNPQLAFNSNNFPTFAGGGNSPITFFIRYTYDPGTDGSGGQACVGRQTRTITIHPLPDVAFGVSPVNAQPFCYDDANVALTASSGLAGSTISFLGYGITNVSSGNASFDPDAAFEAKEFNDNATYVTAQTMTITARATSPVGCPNETTRDLVVRALPPATFTTPPRLVYCYEDIPFTIDGAQTNISFDLINRSTTSPTNFTQSYNADLSFDAKAQFDLGVANGANANSQQDFQLVYTVDDGSGLGCTNSTTIDLTINPALVLDIVGTDPLSTFCENGTQLNLSGNFPGAGKFSTSINGSAFADIGNGLLNGNLPTGNGLATLNLLQAYDAVNDFDDAPPGPVEPFYVRYTYRGPTCTGDAVYTDQIQITAPPVFAFTPPTPADNAAFCFDQSTTPASITIQTNTPANTTRTLSGTNTSFDGSTGTGSWNPTLAFKQREIDLNTTLNSDQTFMLTATATDITYGCVTTITKPLVARTLPPSSFNYANKVEYCYEDGTQNLTGGQLNASYKIVYNNSVPPNYAVTLNQPNIQFDPDVYFEDAVSRGANRLATLSFDVVYTATAGTGCTNRLDTVTFRVSPLIKGEIKGLTNNDIFCSNGTDKILEVTPSGGIFRVDGEITNAPGDRYKFDPPIGGNLGGKIWTFTYTVITGTSCTNTETKSVRVLPSPVAFLPLLPAKCDTAVVSYTAVTTNNLPSSMYTWELQDSIRNGLDMTAIQHRWPGVSSYKLGLKVEHPAYLLPDNSTLVCKDSTSQTQIIGPYPLIDFDFFNVCEEDRTDFDINSNIPISDVSWEFGDDPGSSDRTPFGLLSANVPFSFDPKTIGINERPRHRYDGAGNYVVTVYGRTAAAFGACVDTLTRTISILKKWAPTVTEPHYSMEDLDGGKGFWVIEDRAGNSSWEFASPTGTVIKSSDPAWTTDADGTYRADDDSYVNSPCFDLSTFSRPVISFDHWTDTPPSDGAVLQYSTNGGETWTALGNYDLANGISSGLDWYNTTLISSEPGNQQSGWSRPNQFDWFAGKHTLDVLPVPAATARRQVRFRIAFSSFSNKEGKDGFAFKNVKIEERNRTILVENFSNLSSTANNTAYQNFKALAGTTDFNKAELVKLQYHTPLVPADQLYNDNPIDQSARAAFYGVTQTNKAYIDGGYDRTAPLQSFNANWLDTYFSLRSLVAAPLDISVTLPTTGPADKFNIRTTVTASNAVPAGKYHVFIAVAEKSVLGQLYVLRKLLPDASGTPLTALAPTNPAQIIDVSYDMRHITRTVSGGFNPIAVIVFIQDLEGNKEVLQTIIHEVPVPPSTVVTGIEDINSSFHVFPNPSDNQLLIQLPDNVTEGATLRMFDQVGKIVNRAIFEKGEKKKTIDTSTHAGGVYLLQLETSRGILTRKVMVLHGR